MQQLNVTDCLCYLAWIALAAISLVSAVCYVRTSITSDDDCESHLRLQGAAGAGALVAMLLLCCTSAVVSYIGRSSLEAYAMLGVCHACLLAAAVIDLHLRIIPNCIPLLLLGSRAVLFVYEFIFTTDGIAYLVSSLFALVLCFGVLMIAGKIAKGGIGAGDVKLLSALGFAMGLYAAVCTVIVALITCLLVGAALVLTKRKQRDSELPFAPFAYIGFVGMVCLSL